MAAPEGIEVLRFLFEAQGAVGAEYRSPCGLVLDYLGGDEPPPPLPIGFMGPLDHEEWCFRELQRTVATCRWWRAAYVAWGVGP